MLTCVLAVLASGAAVHAAEIKLLCPVAMKTAMAELIVEFERSTGNKVAVAYGAAGALADRVQKGEVADIAIVTGSQIEALIKQGKVATGSEAKLANVGIGVAVNRGANKPDISSVEAFKRSTRPVIESLAITQALL
jgi:molybdate transport system substrate-binding protein